ncbi:uncharacterized protein EV420DRAFT_1588855 [Desarmillaria tabescens]|uniref:Protein kinase domain-containing protein n=1 Tax=Armillaria tabescens TaxID=1929756 RepID=A0AA39J6N2_ARMTA|nr:uncharacterized protein EV420DRAFT_1588855 [Desarmillaria tabescens]KAK0437122.1 hypothetical protein EV420DRAFT_1588855 [Desarmillaria tabescens]
MCVTFLATLDAERKVVVKFVDRCSEEVHRFNLAGLELAPGILYVGPIGESYGKLRIVVTMEYIQGRTLVAEYRDGPPSRRLSRRVSMH